MKLALLGGEPVRTRPFPQSRTTGHEEVAAAVRVVETGLLSGFAATETDEFLGGPEVRALEAEWAERFGVHEAVACNSATSALLMAVGAAGVGPGDEVIVPPYTMSATAVVPLFYGGVPVFADIEPDYFCIDPASVARRITARTKAIIAADIHGQSSAADKLIALARSAGSTIIFDAAQAGGSMYGGRMTGTVGDIGVYSLNRHKNMQCGEGGIAVTNDSELALRMRLIRNHAESLVGGTRFVPQSLDNMVGLNLRMTEVEASIARVQLTKMDALNGHRIELAKHLEHRLHGVACIEAPKLRPDCTHVFYMQAFKYDDPELGVPRNAVVRALQAEGVPLRGGYLKPLYLEPLFQQLTAIGAHGFPFKGPHYAGELAYQRGACPVAEDLFERRTLLNALLFPPLTTVDMDDIADAVEKVVAGRQQLLEAAICSQ